MRKVFLGGTCAESIWREELIGKLKIDYFDPVVEDWNEEAQEKEIEQREACDYVLYTITPQMKGVYSIAEVVDDSNKRPDKTIFCLLGFYDGGKFTARELMSLYAVLKLVSSNGGRVFTDLDSVANYLNKENNNVTIN